MRATPHERSCALASSGRKYYNKIATPARRQRVPRNHHPRAASCTLFQTACPPLERRRPPQPCPPPAHAPSRLSGHRDGSIRPRTLRPSSSASTSSRRRTDPLGPALHPGRRGRDSAPGRAARLCSPSAMLSHWQSASRPATPACPEPRARAGPHAVIALSREAEQRAARALLLPPAASVAPAAAALTASRPGPAGPTRAADKLPMSRRACPPWYQTAPGATPEFVRLELRLPTPPRERR